MKKILTTAAFTAILITAIPLATSADPSTEENSQFRFLLNQTVIFNGQGNASFKYNSEIEDVRTFIQNTGPKAITYKLLDPSGNGWQSGILEPGKQYLSNYIWDNVQKGTWYWEINNSDGSVGSFKVSTQLMGK